MPFDGPAIISSTYGGYSWKAKLGELLTDVTLVRLKPDAHRRRVSCC